MMIKSTRVALEIAEKYYDEKTLRHVIRVATRAAESIAQDGTVTNVADWVVQVALLHDLLEDTDYTVDELKKYFPSTIVDAVFILTKPKDMSYDDYIERIIKSGNNLAFVVKKADMRDHMMQVDTLTDKLKEKYLPHLWKFL